MTPECSFPSNIPDCGSVIAPATQCLDRCQADEGKSSDECIFNDCASEVATFYCCLGESPMWNGFVNSVANCDNGTMQMCSDISCCSSTGCETPERNACQGIEATENNEDGGDEELSGASREKVVGWAVAFAAMQLFFSWCQN